MPPKKGPAGPTPEERLAQLTARLKHEEEMGVESVQELYSEWIPESRATLKEDLRQDLDLSRQLFQKVMVTKNRVIKTLAGDLMDAAQQQAQAQICHLQFQDQLEALRQKRLAYVDKQWTEGQGELSADFDSERDERLARHQEEMGFLRDAYEVMSQRNFDLKHYLNLDYEAMDHTMVRMQNAKRDYGLRDLTAYQRELDAKAALAAQGQEDEYDKAVAEFHVALQTLQERSTNKKLIKQARKLRRLQRLRDTMVLEQAQSMPGESNARERQFEELRVDTEKAKVKSRQVKQRMTRERNAARDRLTRLVMSTAAAEKRLRDVRTKGERLLFRYEMCVKLASEQEKLPPPPATAPGAAVQYSLCRETAETMAEYRDLERFWQRYNKVRLEGLNLRREEAALTRENQHLTSLVKHFTEL